MINPPDPPLPSDIFAVEDLIGYTMVNGTRYFHVKWMDGGPHTWEPEENIGAGLDEMKEREIAFHELREFADELRRNIEA